MATFVNEVGQMQRGTGTGFIGFGLMLIVVGAVLRFAVTADAKGFDIGHRGADRDLGGGRSNADRPHARAAGRTTLRDDVVNTASGSERVQERDDCSISLTSRSS
jgi:hypothetical protein